MLLAKYIENQLYFIDLFIGAILDFFKIKRLTTPLHSCIKM